MRNISKYILRTALIAAIFVMGEGVMWGNHYAELTVNTNTPSGKGKVYKATNVNGKDETEITKEGEVLSANSGSNQGYVNFYLKPEGESGYHFSNWSIGTLPSGGTCDPSGPNGTSGYYTIEAKTSNSTGDGNAYSYTITANFERDTYTVHFDKNDKGRGVKGDQMPDQTFQRNVEQDISKNEYVLNHTVTYDANGGKVNSQDTWSETKTRFTRWKAYYEGDYNTEIHTDIEFTDGKAISLDEEHGAKLVFQATWADKLYFLFPDAKLGDRSMDGWFYSKTPGQGDTPKGKPGEEVSMTTATLYAKWGDPFYASMSLEKTEGASADPSADYGILSSDYKESELTFNLTAAAPATGYHFTGWSGTDISFTEVSGLSALATVKSSSTSGYVNAASYTATANYEENVYYASLSAKSEGNGTISIDTPSPQSSKVSGGFVEFELSIIPGVGSHLEELTYTPTATGKFVTRDGKTYARVQLPEGNDYGEDKANNYSIKAIFAEDRYNAKLTTKVSSISDESSSSALVSDDGVTWLSEKTTSADSPEYDVTFHVKAIVADGFKFTGWSADDNSEILIPGLGREGTYIVKASTTEGETNADIIYAIFKKQYTIVICSSGEGSGRIVYKVEGPVQYRVSAPINGSVTLVDVPYGEYTITPEIDWSWNSTLEQSQDTGFDPVNKRTVTFKVTPKESVKKKNDETSKTKDYTKSN